MRRGKWIYWSLLAYAVMTPNYAALGKSNSITIGKERKIFMHCEGSGSPTVLFIAGYPDRGDTAWETPLPGNKLTVFSEVSKFTKVCDYDRPGTITIIGSERFLKSRSDPVQQPVTASDQVDDLHQLVNAAKIHKPFIIVAHSAGGLAARLYALKYPNDVSGMLLIDVTNEKLLEVWNEKEIEVFYFGINNSSKSLSSNYKNGEIINFEESFEQLNAYSQHKLNMPAIILTAGKIPKASEVIKMGFWPSYVTQDMANSIIHGINCANNLLADTFAPKAKRIDVKNSGHYIQKEQPELIIQQIQSLIEQLR
ncbi:alpha/beta fold hydrolase [Legionella parisiensis]|uniref:AB hydrolase-1 domain-containing protein n=1 Tax=Legionella parisiensis TaxID=45071 RepID=A0A1E5JRY7_9GAMM|nr:alpha/beta hydrolase [Legionella parisiensis]KTD41071.1 Alpha/beta hydrolase family protein [Legionella parisiensis]OEH47289.1 hypothetical protein lpari_01771 [Legionella parisiensis]STX76636.1 Alpha/beta hydrolase family [Legionella parisiensis]